MAKNKRLFDRIEQNFLGTVLNLENSEISECVIKDLSATGVRVLVPASGFAGKGQRVQVGFDFITLEDEEENVIATGVIRNIFEESKEQMIFGIQFDGPESDRRMLFQTWLTLKFEQERREEMNHID